MDWQKLFEEYLKAGSLAGKISNVTLTLPVHVPAVVYSMVYKLTDDPDGVIIPEESIASPPGEAEKLPPAILIVGEKETDPSTSSQLLLLVYESVGVSFAVIVMVKDEVFVHVPAVVYDTV